MLAGAFLLGIVAPVLILDLTHGQPFIGWIRDNFFGLGQEQLVAAAAADESEESVVPERLTGAPDRFQPNQLLH